MIWLIVGIVGLALVVLWGCVWYKRRSSSQDEWSKYTVQFRDYVEQRRRIACLGGFSCDLSIESLVCAFSAEKDGASPFAGDTTRRLLRQFMRENGISEYS